MADWIVAPCLNKLLAQANALAPKRSKASDGSIGDQAHAIRNSEHNPKKLAFCPTPLVRARDFTHDPAGGFDSGAFVERLIKSRDSRIKYLIWNRRIWYPSSGWKPYSGINAHTHHCHVSVIDDMTIMDSRDWNINVLEDRMALTPEDIQRVADAVLKTPVENFNKDKVSIVQILNGVESKLATIVAQTEK